MAKSLPPEKSVNTEGDGVVADLASDEEIDRPWVRFKSLAQRLAGVSPKELDEQARRYKASRRIRQKED
jgi:hypothetical protein